MAGIFCPSQFLLYAFVFPEYTCSWGVQGGGVKGGELTEEWGLEQEQAVLYAMRRINNRKKSLGYLFLFSAVTNSDDQLKFLLILATAKPAPD